MRNSDTVSVDIAIGLADSDTTNSRMNTSVFHLAAPVLMIDLDSFPPDAYADHPFPVVVRVRNVSHYATFEPHALGFCLTDGFGLGCRANQGYTATNMVEMPALAPNEEFVLREMTVENLSADQNGATDYFLFPCVADSGTDAAELSEDMGTYYPACFFDYVEIRVRPNYEVCEPALLIPDSAVTSRSVCTLPTRRGYYYRLQAVPGVTYTLHLSDGTEPIRYFFLTPDGEMAEDASPAPGFQPTSNGTYYIEAYLDGYRSFLPPTIAVTLRAEPLMTGSGQ
jgi:hypothetical protein